MFSWQILDNWGDLESTGFVIRHEDLEDKVFVGVVLDQCGSLHDFSDLESGQIDFVLGERQIGPSDFADVMKLELGGGDLSSDDLAAYSVLLSIVLAVAESVGVEYEMRLDGLKRKQFQQRLVILDRHILLQVEQYLLRQLTLILQLYLNLRR